jgi:hypothetical protein
MSPLLAAPDMRGRGTRTLEAQTARAARNLQGGKRSEAERAEQ